MHYRNGVRSISVVVLAALGMCLQAQERTTENVQRDRRLREARAALSSRLKDGLEGRLVERFPGSYVFIPLSVDLPRADVINPAAVATLAIGPRVLVHGSLDGSGKLTIADVALPLRQPAAIQPPEGVATALRNVRSTLAGALRPGAMSVSTRSIDDPAPAARNLRRNLADIRNAYSEARRTGDHQRLLAIVREWALIRRDVADFFPDSQDFKALYGPLDNYEPWRYDVIFRQSRGVVAIGAVNAIPPSRCSGVLIAPDLVITAAHCLGGSDPKDPDELEVWFDYARSQDGTVPAFLRRRVVELIAPTPARLQDLKDGRFDSTLLDYLILRFEAPDGQPLSPAGAEPLCIRSRPLRKGDPIYVVGYPRGDPIMVHDSARVYLPYRVRDGAEFEELRLNVDADLLGFADRAIHMQEFDRSYATVRQQGALTFRFLHHVQDNEQPRMGIIADTFRGNSGGPVFDRENSQCVVGILIAGSPDTGERLTVNWKQHERVLPIGAVMEDAERHVAGLRARLKVIE